jgi:hypothetical protein
MMIYYKWWRKMMIVPSSLIPRRERQMVKQKVAFRRNSELKMLLWLFERTGNGKCYKTAIGIARGYGWMAWVRFPAVQDFSLLPSAQTDPGAYTPSYLMGTGALSLGVEQQA